MVPRHLALYVTVALVSPFHATAQDGLLRLSCVGSTETATATISPNLRKTRETKSVTITVNPETGLAQFQNLGLIAFNMANEPVRCTVTPSEIHCNKEHKSSSEITLTSNVLINRYSGQLTEYQTLSNAASNNPSMTSFSGEYTCQSLRKPLF